MKIFLLKILILISLNCYSQYLVKSEIDRDIFSRNETIKISYVLESNKYINLQFAVIKSNDKGEHKFDTITSESIQTIRTTSLVDSVITNKCRFVATKKILPSHVGSFELPICEFHLKDTILCSKPITVSIIRSRVSKGKLLTDSYRDNRYKNIIIISKEKGKELLIEKDKLPNVISLKDTIKIRFGCWLDYETAECGFEHTQTSLFNLILLERKFDIFEAFGATSKVDFILSKRINVTYKDEPWYPIKGNSIRTIPFEKIYGITPIKPGIAKLHLGNIRYASKTYRLGNIKIRVIR
jgi:hypothetical protein